jgi:hypothetical protein
MKKSILIAAAVMLAGISHGQMFAQLFGQTWTPASLGSKLAIWYDASDATTVLDVGDAVATNGVSVQTWSDKSGNARHAYSPGAAQRPTYQTAVQNGRAVVRSTGASQMNMTNSASVFRNRTGGYIFVVAKDANQAGGDASHVVVFFSTSVSAGSTRLSVLGRNATTAAWAVGGRRLDADAYTTRNGSAATGHNVICSFGDWGNGNLRTSLNGSAYASQELASGAGATTDGDSLAAMLFRSGASDEIVADSEIAEIIVVNAAMSASEIASMNAYLKAKWGTP